MTLAIALAVVTAFGCGVCADRALTSSRRSVRLPISPIIGGTLCGATCLAFLALALRM